jgi:twitching motility protein PilT
MARIDSLLAIAVDQGANELRVGANREPRMFASGAPKRLLMPAMGGDTVKELLGEILSPERAAVLQVRGKLDVAYSSDTLGVFQVTLSAREDGVDAVFLRLGPKAGAKAPQSSVAAPVAPSVTFLSSSGASPASSWPPAPATEARATSGRTVGPSAALLKLLGKAHALGASDLHLQDGEPAVVRTDGHLFQLDDEPTSVRGAFVWDEDAFERLGREGSLDAGSDLQELGRIRVHIYRTATGPAAAIRLLPAGAPALASLHLPLPLDDLAMLPNGLVLVCGATGSGKSTTLAALAQEALRRRSILLVTLEDPIEYALAPSSRSLVRRRWIGRDSPSFASGLRDALREDPDVILVGEMRDPETIGLALTAAETGHLVLASIHSRSAASAIERIVDAYAPERQRQIRVQLADALRAIVAQRLVPRAEGDVTSDPVAQPYRGLPPRTRRGGRIPAIELLRANHAVASLIREGKTEQIATAIQSGRRDGMITLERCLADRVQAGDIKAEDARAVANDLDSLAVYLGK